MKHLLPAFAVVCCVIGGILFTTAPTSHHIVPRLVEFQGEGEEEGSLDNDWFLTQRSYPREEIPAGAVASMRMQMTSMKASAKASALSMSPWSPAGPTNIGGRIAAVEIDPVNPDIIYAGSASGGVWKSTNFGTSWTNIFNHAFSIGALQLDPLNPSVLYVGTGEANPGGVACYPGNGIWRSTDAGVTWTNLGLTLTGHIGKIAIDPSNTNRLFVAALGLYRGKTADRGVYRSTDGGSSWSKVFYLNDTTGAIDLVIDPANPNNVLAAMWLRYRTPAKSDLQGGATGLYRSTDGGTTWNIVTTGFPSATAALGRVALALAPSSPSTVYALAASGASFGGVYKSTNSGASWSQPFVNSSFGESQVWFNNIITVHPANPDIIWAGMTNLYKSTDGGTTVDYASFGGWYHVDHHAMKYAPSNSNRIVLGNDGGIYLSVDGGANWTKSFNLPVTQFYAGTIDFQNPFRLLGGTQDNNTVKTDDGQEYTWYPILGGDGFVPLVDPTDSDYVYAESQYGGIAYSTDGGASFYGGTNGINGSDRKNWQTPIAMNYQNPKTLFTGTQYVYRTRNHMQSWTQISSDLTYGNGGRVGTISTIDVARSDSNVIYVGTDDGRIWVTTNGGALWSDIGKTLPERWVTRVTVDPFHPEIAYVTLSGFIVYDFGGHVYRTTNYGVSWTDISSNLPDIPVNDIIIDPADTRHLFVANDLAVMWSTNLGVSWAVLGTGLPDVPVNDLELHSPTRTLVAFTHGRSAFRITIDPANGPARLAVSVRSRWNLVSMPIEPDNRAATAIYPTATSPAYRFSGASGYELSDSLEPGLGYWMKFPAVQTVSMEGIPVVAETVNVQVGWNLIGSVFAPGPVSGMTSSPPDAIIAPVYMYDGAYKEATTITPGKGYWVKMASAGEVYIPAGTSFRKSGDVPAQKAKMSVVTFRVDESTSQDLRVSSSSNPEQGGSWFDLPPAPPQGIFDVRFRSGRHTEFLHGSEAGEYPVTISSAGQQVEVSAVPEDGSTSIVLVVDGDATSLAGGAATVIPAGVHDVRLQISHPSTPVAFALEQNYPNPFNPTTVIRYALPVDGYVTVSVFNVLGQVVTTLVDGEMSTGRQSVVWNGLDASGREVSGGIYFCRLIVRNGGTVRYAETRKMMLMK